MKLASIFETVLNMSLTGSIVILVVCLARLLLKRAPKIYSYALWALVLFRLLCPVAISSELSLIPEKVSTGSALNQWEDDYVGDTETIFDSHPQFQTALDAGRDPISAGENGQYVVTALDKVSQPATVENRILPVLAVVWLVGLTAMGLYGAVSFLKIRRQTRVSVPAGKNVYLADDVRSPFVMGVFRPKIYLPGTLAESEREFILCHEQHHIRRGDPIFKALGFLALAIHWFNPLVWLAFSLASRDMEMSCDEAVIRKMGENVRAEYSAALLNLATGRRIVSVTPLAFGEGDPKGRIRNLANWKKPAFWGAVVCVILCVVLGVCLLTNPKETSDVPVNISFADLDTSGITEVSLQNLHNGVITYVTDPEDVSSLCEYIKGISGINGGSAKGYYEGTFGVRLLHNYKETFSLSFGDSSTFYHGKGADGYSIRYELADRDISDVTAFLSQYDSSAQEENAIWGITMTLENVSQVGAVAVFNDDGSVNGVNGVEVTYGDDLSLERQENGSWVSVEELPGFNHYVADSSHTIRDREGMFHEWQSRYGELTDGTYRIGKLLTLRRGDGSTEEQMIYGTFAIPDSIRTTPAPLEELPEIYSAEQAALDGCFVSEDGVAWQNKEAFQQFAQDAANGIPGSVRLVNWHHGEDAQWSAMDLSFDGREYLLQGLSDSYTFRYLKHFTGTKDKEDAEYDRYEYYILVNDNSVTLQDIHSGKLDMSYWATPTYWTVYADYTYLPDHPELPDNINYARLEFLDEELVLVTNPDYLEKLIWMFENAEYLGYEPKTHSIGTGLNLIFTAGDEDYVIELDLDNDVCRIDEEYVFYGAPDEPNYLYKVWECLGITRWPDIVYQVYPNALRPGESVFETLPFDFLLPDGYTTQYKSSKEVSIVMDNQIIGGIIDTGLEASCITDTESGEADAFLNSIVSPPIRAQYFANVWDNKLYVSLTLENFETGEQQEQSHCLFESESECFDIWVDRALVDDEDRDFLFKTVASQ